MRPSPWVDRISYRWVFAVRQAALVNETSTVASRAAASLSSSVNVGTCSPDSSREIAA
ncbi:protein of unknown function [Nocardia cyriacigeorgica GUH-2]|uniref:Uncharacterized protein n=1 Tax=Nocardia cyriacigeorgica (strain GUH-2) TaxID=1127134 RepID=H6QZC0_NOCCG|nr:protein of unknown function [Nocardia cyriacigeorgica GUH-2]